MEGYDKLALLLSEYPELTAVRKFSRWSLKTLLFQQAEIAWLEHELDTLIGFDTEDPEKVKFVKDWKHLSDESLDANIVKRRDMMEKLHMKLQKYHAALLQTSKVLSLPTAQEPSVATLKKWLEMKSGGKQFLNHIELSPWDDTNLKDLVCLAPGSGADKFGERLGNKLSTPYHALIGRHRKPSSDKRLGDVWEYDRAAFTFLGNVICMLFSFVLPTASIFALYYVRSMLARLFMISGFILIFAFAMMFAVGSRRGEVFAATAAFAALQVFFLGGINITQKGLS